MYNQNTIQSKHSQAQNSHKTINNSEVVNYSLRLTLKQAKRLKIYTFYSNKKWKKDCLAGELFYGYVGVSYRELATIAKCSTKTVARDMEIFGLDRFQGKDRGRKVMIDKLNCRVGEQRYYYAFVPTVKETTNVVRIRNTEIRTFTHKGINFLRKEDCKYELFKKSGEYNDEQLLKRDDPECKNVTTKAIKVGLLEEIGKELGIPRVRMLVYGEQFVIWHRLRQSLLIDQKESIRGYVKKCKESGFENHWQFKRSLSYRTGEKV